jgi:L-alanine-DL-glutamate epimerase-like enolase superfamily enzyme
MSTSTLAASVARIAGLSASAYTIPTDAPEADGTLAWDKTTLIVAEARCADVVGIGWTYGSSACADIINELLADALVGRRALDVAGCFEAMVNAIRNVGRGGVGGQAISAVDVALWDLKARILELPLHHLIGAVHDAAPVYGSGGFTTYDAQRLREQLTAWAKELGIPRVKIKIGESWGTRVDRDLARMAQARDVIGDHVELYVDANGAYGAKQAVRMMNQAAELDIRWLEEPVSSDDLAGLAEVRNAVSADVAAGEYGYDSYYFRRMCEAGAVDCLQADASRCGGITGWLHAAAVAAAHGLQISGHCAPHLHAPAALATPNLRHLEWFHDHARIETLYFDGAVLPLDGLMRLDATRPGHGLTPRREELETYQVR